MSTFYPSIYDNAYKYNILQNNSIVITTQTGFADVAAESNTVLVCNENGQWVTSSLNNFATSTDITNIQNSINNLSTYDDILQQSISSNLTAINTLQTNLTNNYFTKDEITYSNDLLINMLGETFDEIYGHIETLSNEVTIISNNVQILTENLLYVERTYNVFPFANNNNLGHDIYLEGTWKLYGTVTLYITDISKMTPTDNTLTEREWIYSLPIFEIKIDSLSVFQAKIESNRPLMTIPVNALLTDFAYSNYGMYSSIILPSPSDINITVDDIRLYSYNLYLERISGYDYIDDSQA